jgi:hypothetical protein
MSEDKPSEWATETGRFRWLLRTIPRGFEDGRRRVDRDDEWDELQREEYRRAQTRMFILKVITVVLSFIGSFILGLVSGGTGSFF